MFGRIILKRCESDYSILIFCQKISEKLCPNTLPLKLRGKLNVIDVE
ncbi:hypothetical protein Q7C_1423 [Methylophaga frappieri]|uniref:Uncharacterized protein n=1 Tax=Methylophaga frappieri (strain ATCC BAA-2434 / DSM 25690 / JAM7) TaxID=754477 RepID=I1YI30_METFJ|nr:hypothetical protein Q7C_1423 [Methylophaga frappieri]